MISFLLIGFIANLVIETVAYIAFYIKMKGVSSIILYSLLLNLFTWPVAQAVYSGSIPSFILIETTVIIVEGFLLKAITKSKYSIALAASLTANILSIFLGILLC